MSLGINIHSARPHPLGLWLAVLISFAPFVEVRSQATGLDDTLLPPTKPGLVPVHFPDLTKLEADVRQQLISLQNTIAAVVKDPATAVPKLSESYGRLGEIYHAYSLVAPAYECYLNAVRLAPKDFRWNYLLAKLDQQEGRVDDAIRRYKMAGSLDQSYVAVPVNLGNIYLELNRLDDARKLFEAALKIDEQNPAAEYGLGQVALSRRYYREAIAFFEKALARVPEANRIHYSLAMAYRGSGDAERARFHFGRQGPTGVRTADPLVDRLQELIKGERVHLVRGRLALEAKRYAEAVSELSRAVDANPESVPARVNLGAALTQIGELKRAVEQFDQVLRLDPNNVSARYNLALLLAHENKHAQAILHLQHISQVDPYDFNARFLLAQELSKSDRLDEALDEFSRIVRDNPENEEALIEWVKLLHRRGDFKQALAALERSHARYPQKGETAVLLAYLLAASPQYELRDGARALELAQLAYKTTGSLRHGVLVSMALAELGRCRDAAGWQEKMIALAEREGLTAPLAKMRADLQRYEGAPTCRPSIEALPSNR